MSTLECSTKGDARFSAMWARVSVNGVVDTIENHYQKSKVFKIDGNIVRPKTINEAKNWQHKGNKPIAFVLGKFTYPVELLSMWYESLWWKYLMEHKDLYKYACGFDTFTDSYKRKNTMNCQAEVIEYAVKNGLKELYKKLKPFFDAIEKDRRK